MIIAGASGHAKEILGVLLQSPHEEDIYFFDDMNEYPSPKLVLEKYSVITSLEEVKKYFLKNPLFVLGVGNPDIRKTLAEKLVSAGGNFQSVISPYSQIGRYNNLGNGLNVMTGAVITEDVNVGDGALIHINVSIHHDCKIGQFCELSPGCIILGNVTIGEFSRVGAGAVILPGITIGKHVTIGAGSVVTKDVQDGVTVKGIPAG